MSPPQIALVVGFIVFAVSAYIGMGPVSLGLDAGLLIMGYALVAEN